MGDGWVGDGWVGPGFVHLSGLPFKWGTAIPALPSPLPSRAGLCHLRVTRMGVLDTHSATITEIYLGWQSWTASRDSDPWMEPQEISALTWGDWGGRLQGPEVTLCWENWGL